MPVGSIGERLKALRLKAGLTQEEVGQHVHISKQTLYKYENGIVTNIPADKIELLATIYSVTPAYIMGWATPTAELPSAPYRYVPASVAAGSLTTIEGLTDLPLVTVPDCMLGRYARNKNIILMPVSGESMNNVIRNGAIIAVLTKVELPQIRNGDIVVVSNSGDYTVKRFFNDKEHQEFIFRPDSSDMSYRDIIFSYDNCEDLQLVGKVVMYNVTL